jgi:AbrB family looped-hinge helix DNA binding protein
MPRITSKLQITIPKRLAEQVGLGPGDEVEFLAAGDGIRMVPAGKSRVGGLSTAERLRLFRAATERQQARDKARPLERVEGERVEGGRGWTRAELYTRAKPR